MPDHPLRTLTNDLEDVNAPLIADTSSIDECPRRGVASRELA